MVHRYIVVHIAQLQALPGQHSTSAGAGTRDVARYRVRSAGSARLYLKLFAGRVTREGSKRVPQSSASQQLAAPL